MVMLSHEVIASDALDDYVESQLAEATELRYFDVKSTLLWDCGDVILYWTPAKCRGKYKGP